MSDGNLRDPDDFFADTRMSFGDHIEELRTHLIRAIAGFMVALVFGLFFGSWMLDFITEPVKEQLHAFYNRRLSKVKKELATDPHLTLINKPTEFTQIAIPRDQLQAVFAGKPTEEINAYKRPVVKKPKAEKSMTSRLLGSVLGGDEEDERTLADNEQEIAPDQLVKLWIRHEKPVDQAAVLLEAIRRVGEFDTLSTLSVTEAFMTYFKVCLLCGLILGSPWIFYQIWAFIAAGLYPHEKKLVHVYLPISLGLFLAGALMCQFLVIPRAISALLWFNEWLGFKPDLRLNEWLGFAILLPVIFGVSFQTPLVMMFLARLGIMSADAFRKQWRMAYFLLAVFAAVITPTPDAITMLMLWVPMAGLFELGILLIRVSERHRNLQPEESEEDRLVEV